MDMGRLREVADWHFSGLSGLHEVDSRMPEQAWRRRLGELLIDDVCRRPFEPLQAVARSSSSALAIAAASKNHDC